jgi:hypothetical protein
MPRPVAAGHRSASRDVFCAVEQHRRTDFERFGDPEDVCERDVALATLDRTEVRAVQAALQREGFLGDALLLADGTDRVAECDVCWRSRSTRLRQGDLIRRST